MDGVQIITTKPPSVIIPYFYNNFRTFRCCLSKTSSFVFFLHARSFFSLENLLVTFLCNFYSLTKLTFCFQTVIFFNYRAVILKVRFLAQIFVSQKCLAISFRSLPSKFWIVCMWFYTNMVLLRTFHVTFALNTFLSNFEYIKIFAYSTYHK